jgi:DNA repair protein RecO (recombination protein O)
MEEPLALALLASACAVAEGALPDRVAHPRSFQGLVQVIARLAEGGEAALPDYISWEAELLAELGYGLDLARCATTGATEGLAYVSPRSGRAVTEEGAGPWREKLLPLPAFLWREASSGPAEWLLGLRLTGHFLAKDAFGHQHRPVPPARGMLEDRVAALAQSSSGSS